MIFQFGLEPVSIQRIGILFEVLMELVTCTRIYMEFVRTLGGEKRQSQCFPILLILGDVDNPPSLAIDRNCRFSQYI